MSRFQKNPAQQVEFREFRPQAEIKAEHGFGGGRHDPPCYISNAALVEQTFTAYLESCSVLGAESFLDTSCDNSFPNFKNLSYFSRCEREFAGSVQIQHLLDSSSLAQWRFFNHRLQILHSMCTCGHFTGYFILSNCLS